MRDLKHIKTVKATMTILVALTLFAHNALCQNVITMPSVGSQCDTLEAGSSYTIFDPGGAANYPNSCSSTIKLVSRCGTPITISGLIRTEFNYDFLLVYEGHNSNSPLIAKYSGLENANITALTGVVTLVFSSNSQINHNGFALTVSVCDTSENAINNIGIDTITQNSATLAWNGEGLSDGCDGWTIHYGLTPSSIDSSVTTSDCTVTINGLAANTEYYYYIANGTDTCDIRLHTLRTSCEENRGNCINYSDLASCYVKGTFGTFHNPWQHRGIFDLGSGSSLSHQTVHSNTEETDPRTNNQLHTVPTGYSASVRLGNWEVGGQAESITYEYEVDTMVNDLLLLKYAAVMQVPNHSPSEQPRFTFMIMDENGNEINSSCYSANFIASSSLGWNSCHYYGAGSLGPANSDVLWKDWTTVGIDLAPLHGETIYIHLTTSDCAHEQHFGYAYFVLDCTTKTLTAESCGPMPENTFTAPEGFNYQWYCTSQPTAILSTSRSLHVTEAGEYRCRLSFVDAPTDGDCSFEISAVAASRFPAAIISWDSIARNGCDLMVQLHNNSVISRDTGRTVLTTLPCDMVEWMIDDESYSFEDEPIANLTPGLHTIQLVAMLGNGSCTDTTTETIFVANPCYRNDTIWKSICDGDTAWLFDTPYDSTGIFVGDSGYHHRTLILSVGQKYNDTIDISILENELPYCLAGVSFHNSVDDTTIRLTSVQNCDSVFHFSLNVYPNTFSILDSIICENELPMTWNNVTFYSDSSASETLAGAARSGADSTVIMTVIIKRNSSFSSHDTVVENQLPLFFGGQAFTGIVLDSTFVIPNHEGCDSVLTYSLHVWFNVSNIADSSVCDSQLPITWNGVTFSNTGSETVNLATLGIHASHGEDSIITMRLNVISSTSSMVKDTVVENELPVTYLGQTFDYPIDTLFTIKNVENCDSNISFSLQVWFNELQELDSTICSNQLPLCWNGHTFTGDSTQELPRPRGHSSATFNHIVTLLNCHGADSIINMTLNVLPTYSIFDTAILCEGETTPEGFTESGDRVLSLMSVDHCDSTVHLHVIVHPIYNQHFDDTICDNQTVVFNGEDVNSAGLHQVHLLSVNGCDSMVTLSLSVNQTYHQYHRAVVCDGVPYQWIDGNTYSQSTYEPKIIYSDINGCDSVLHLLLDLDDNFKAKMEIAPEIVDVDHPIVRLRDLSHSHSRLWYYEKIGNNAQVRPTSSWPNIELIDDSSRIATFLFPPEEDSIRVLLVARTMAGCIDSVWGNVRCDRAVYWAPNAFTPDETQNNKFFISGNQIASGDVWVYNRQGLLVSHFEVVNGSWDGTYRGVACPQATYTWVMKYTTVAQPRQSHTAKGTVTIVR